MSHFVYILQCADNTLYVGYTTDIDRRLVEHNTSKLGARYTKARRPVTLKYSEKFETKGEALKREYQLKQLSRGEKLELF